MMKVVRFYGKSLICCLLASLGLFVCSTTAWGALDNKGTEFIMAFNPNTLGGGLAEQVQLHLTADVATNVTVQYPMIAPTFNTTVAVNPGTVTIVTLPVAASTGWAANTTANNLVHAFSDNEFVCYMINRRTASSDDRRRKHPDRHDHQRRPACGPHQRQRLHPDTERNFCMRPYL